MEFHQTFSILTLQIIIRVDPPEAGELSFQRPGDDPLVTYGARMQSASVISLKSELNAANGALEGLCFSPSREFSGPAVIIIVVNDDGATGRGGALSANSTVSLVVLPVNDPFEVMVPRLHRRSGGRGPMPIEGIKIDDVDSTEGEVVTVNATVDTGSIFVEYSPAVSVVSYGEASSGMPAGISMTGLLHDIKRALSNVWFLPPSEGWEGGGVVRISATDGQGAVGEAECVMIVSDPDVEPIITVTNASLIVDQGIASPLRGLHVRDPVVDAAILVGAIPPMFYVNVVAKNGGIGLNPVPSGLSPIAGTDTATAALATISSGTGLVGIFGTPRSTLSFRGTLEAVNEAFGALVYLSADGTAGLGNDSVAVKTTRRGNVQDHSTYGELMVDVRPVNQPPIVSWAPTTSPSGAMGLEGMPLFGLRVEDSDLPEGGVLKVQIEMLHDDDSIVVWSAGEGVEFSVGSAYGAPSSVLAFRGNISSITNLLSSSTCVLANPVVMGILRVQVEDNDGGKSSLEVEIQGNHVNTSPEVQVASNVNLVIKEREVLERIGELAGIEIADPDVDDSPNGYLDMHVLVSHRSVLEVQQVTTSATRINPVQTVSTFLSANGSATLGGTFNLTLDLSQLCDECKVETTEPIWHDAVANENDNYIGSETGDEGGESLQAKLESLPSLHTLGITIFCQRDMGLTSAGGRKWRVTFLGAPTSLPVMQPSGDLLTGDSPGVETASVVTGNSLSGSFTLFFGGYATERIRHSADPRDVAAALEAIPSITAVDVTMPDPPDPQGGRQWFVTFFDVLGAGGDMPLMEVDGKTLGGKGATVSVIEAVRGNGVPDLWEVSTSATHQNMVNVITMTGALKAKGYFQLGLDYGGTQSWTRPIYPRAVGPVSDESRAWWSFGGVSGRKRGESVESRLKLLGNWGELGPDADVLVQRVESIDEDTVQWYITFTASPEDLPMPSIRGSRLSGGAAISATVVASHNTVEGFFFLQYGGVSTPPLPHDSTGVDVATALNALETIHSTDIGTGLVTATRTHKISLEGGHKWTIAFLRDPENLTNITATGNFATGLTGASARATARLVRSGGRGAVLRLVDLGGAAFGIPGYTTGEHLNILGSPNTVTNALASLSYSPVPGWSGDADIIFRVNDGGFTGTGGVQSGWAMISVAVEAVNDPPVVMWCGEVLVSGELIEGVDEDAPFRLIDYDCDVGGTPETPTQYDHLDRGGPGLGLRVYDPDNGASIVQARVNMMP